jgi:arylsulfatase A-like enzyme
MTMKKPHIVAIMADDVGIWNISAYRRRSRHCHLLEFLLVDMPAHPGDRAIKMG